MKEPNLYDKLGITRDYTPKKLRKRFRKLSLRYHPDKVDQSLSPAEKEKIQTEYEDLVKIYKMFKNPVHAFYYDRCNINLAHPKNFGPYEIQDMERNHTDTDR